MEYLQPIKVAYEEQAFQVEAEMIEQQVENQTLQQSALINSYILLNSQCPTNYQLQNMQQLLPIQKFIKIKVIDYIRRGKFEGILTSNTVEIKTNRHFNLEGVYANLVSELQKKQLITELFSIHQGNNEYQISIKVTFIIGSQKRSFDILIQLKPVNLEIDEKLELQQILLEKNFKNTIEALQNQQQQKIQQMEQNQKNSFQYQQSLFEQLKQSIEYSAIITQPSTTNNKLNIDLINNIDNIIYQMKDVRQQIQQNKLLNQIQPNKQPDMNNSQVNPSLDNEIKEKLTKLKKKFKKFKKNQPENNTYQEQLEKLEQQVSELSKKFQEIKLQLKPNPGKIDQNQNYLKYNFQVNPQHEDPEEFYIGPVFQQDSEFSFMLLDSESNFYVGILNNGDMSFIESAQACFIEIPTGKYRLGCQEEFEAKQFFYIHSKIKTQQLSESIQIKIYFNLEINNNIKQAAAFFFKTNEYQLDDLVDYSGQY